MKHFLQVADGIDVLPTLLALQERPELWDEFRERTAPEHSPHHGASDIWLRYRDRAELTSPDAYLTPHISVWHSAWEALKAPLTPIVFGLLARCQATGLGGVFLTRIPPGGRIAPHDDAYSWHARHYPFKVYVPLASNGRVINRVLEEEVVMGVGSAWYFNNLVEHSVENNGDSERVTLIVCMRRD